MTKDNGRLRRASFLLSIAVLVGIFLSISQPTIFSYISSSRNFSFISPRTLDTLRRFSFNIPSPGGGERRAVILTVATKNYARFVDNIHCSVRSASGREIIIFSLDAAIFKQSSKRQYPTVKAYYDHEDIASSENPYLYGTKEFNIVTHLKFTAVRDTLKAGYDVLFTDADVVWCDRAPEHILEFAAKLGHGDIFIQNAFDPDDHWPVIPNTGFFYAMSKPRVIQLFDELVNMSKSGNYNRFHDQDLFYRIVCKNSTGDGGQFNSTNTGPSGHHCEWGKNGEEKVEVMLLPLSKFTHGRNPLDVPFYLIPRGQLRQNCVEKKMVVWHNNFVLAPQKVVRMDVHHLWSADSNGDCININSTSLNP